jgi:phage shock protein PspC (stress-responsive transcriptional regulator)
MLLIVFTFLHVCIYIISAVIMTKRYVDREEDKISRAIPVWVVLCLHAIVAVFLLQLIALHFYLIFRGITTYEFLQEKRRK